MIEVLDGKMSAYKADLQKAVDAHNEAFDGKVKDINEDLAKKGATLEEIQETLKEVQKAQGRIAANFKTEVKNFATEFNKTIEQKAGEIGKLSKGAPVSFKLEGVNMDTKSVANMTLGGHLTGSGVATYSNEPAVRGVRKVHFRDIPGVQVINSATGIWKFYRQNSPVGEGSFGVQTEGSAKAQIDFDLTEVTVNVDTIAGFTRISKQMLRDLPFMQSFLPSELRESYFRDEDNKFINTLMPYCSAGTTSATPYAEKLIDYLTGIWAADYDPTAIVTTAANWGELLKTKPSDYSIPGGVTIDDMGNVMFAGVPVVILNGMTSGKTFTGDFSRIKIIQSAGLSINFYEQDSDNVQKNLTTVRAECEAALAVLRTDAVVYN